MPSFYPGDRGESPVTGPAPFLSLRGPGRSSPPISPSSVSCRDDTGPAWRAPGVDRAFILDERYGAGPHPGISTTRSRLRGGSRSRSNRRGRWTDAALARGIRVVVSDWCGTSEPLIWRKTLFHSSPRSEGSGCLKKTAYVTFYCHSKPISGIDLLLFWTRAQVQLRYYEQ